MNVAIFASGAGSNALKLIDCSLRLKNIKIPLVILDRADSPLPQSLETTFGEKIKCMVIAPPQENLPAQARRAKHEEEILKVLSAHQIEWIFLAGYMRILGPTLLNAFATNSARTRIVNIHPSLLPAYPGAHSYERAFQEGEPSSGVTVHLVDAGVDTGPILKQESFERRPKDTLNEFINRGKSVEWKLYAEILSQLDREGKL
jgi:phosphoribosylglycinamide formyltransferase-1